jgi:hypothetical protein
MSSTLPGIVPSPIAVAEHEVGGITNILKDAAELAFHLSREAGHEEQPLAQAAGASCMTRGQTLRMIPAAPRSGESLVESAVEPPQSSGVRVAPPSSSGLVMLPYAPVITLAPFPPTAVAPWRAAKTSSAARKAWIACAILVAANLVLGAFVLARALWAP